MSSRFIHWSDCNGVWHGYHRYLWDFLHHIYSGEYWCGGWQLMWPFRFVAILVCGRSGLWPYLPFRFVAVSVCGRYDLLPRFATGPLKNRALEWNRLSPSTSGKDSNLNLPEMPKAILTKPQSWINNCTQKSGCRLFAKSYDNRSVLLFVY